MLGAMYARDFFQKMSRGKQGFGADINADLAKGDLMDQEDLSPLRKRKDPENEGSAEQK